MTYVRLWCIDTVTIIHWFLGIGSNIWSNDHSWTFLGCLASNRANACTWWICWRQKIFSARVHQLLHQLLWCMIIIMWVACVCCNHRILFKLTTDTQLGNGRYLCKSHSIAVCISINESTDCCLYCRWWRRTKLWVCIQSCWSWTER